MSYTLNWELKGAFIEFYTNPTINDIQRGNGELNKNKKFKKIKYVIWDFSNVSLLNIKSEEVTLPVITNLIESEKTPMLKIAIIVTEPYGVELCKKYIDYVQTMNISWETEIFETVELALKWCSL